MSEINGVGLGLRWELIDEMLERKPALDFVEVSPENYMGRGGYHDEALDRAIATWPIVSHGLTMSFGGSDPLREDYLAGLSRFLDRVKSPWHSDHLCFSTHGGVVLHDLLPIAFKEREVWRVAERIKRARDAIKRPVAVENISFYMHPGKKEMSEAEFVARVCDAADCKLMLDVNNAYVNAQNFGFDVDEWMRTVPLDSVIQIHVAGHDLFDDEDTDGKLIVDTHGADVCDPVLELLERTLRKTGPVPVLLERDQKIPPLDALLAEVARIKVISGAGDGVMSKGERLQGMIARACLGKTRAFDDDVRAFLASHEIDPEDVEALAGGPRRLGLYRRLVRRNVFDVIETMLARTRSRLEAHAPGAFDGAVAAFLDEVGPRTPHLRDVPSEFLAFAAPRWRERGANASVPPWLADFAELELADFTIAVAPRSAPPPPVDEVAPDWPLVFAEPTTFVRLAWAVQGLADDATPTETPVTLLVYRDAEHAARFLELTPLAAAILERLFAGRPLAAAMTEACASMNAPLDPEVLDGAARLLADLGERGVLLGARAGDDAATTKEHP